ncbi:MAG: toll/interleukin-1 receptor domain-containing protein [Acidobacteriota bacterium]
MYSKAESLDDFLIAAVFALLSKRGDDFTWVQDEATLTAALETAFEFLVGPEPFCRYSEIRRQADGIPATLEYWLRFDHEARQSEYARALESESRYILVDLESARYKGKKLRIQRLGDFDGVRDGFGDEAKDRVRNDEDAWLTVRWERLAEIDPQDEHIEGSFGLRDYDTYEAWLHAQIGYLMLHDLWPTDITHNRLALRFTSLLEDTEIPPWKSRLVSDIETTSIVAQFLFHRCTLHFLNDDPNGSKISRLFDITLDWIIKQQCSDGSWATSPHVTSHCIRAIAEHARLRKECKSSVERAMNYLLSPEIIPIWNQLDTYKRIEVLQTIIRIRRLDYFNEFTSDIKIQGGFRQPTVFVSYAGCDVDFAKKLSRALETNNVPVWFAEWDIDYGDDIVEQIQFGMESTRSFIIVLSPESVSRPWVRKELATAFFQELSGPGKLIIPLRYKDCELPSFLRTHKWIDFSRSEEFDSLAQDLARTLKQQRKDRR